MMMKLISDLNAAATATDTGKINLPAVKLAPADGTNIADSVELSAEAQSWKTDRPDLLNRIANIRKQIHDGTYATDDKINAILGDIQSEIHRPRQMRRRA